MKKGDTVEIVALSFAFREKWSGKKFAITSVFVPKGSEEKWARLDGSGGIWPLRMLRAA